MKYSSDNIDKRMKWEPPAGWQKITAIDAHTEGEPFRVITGGFPEIRGDTILEKRKYVQKNFDHLRTALMWEPRGHADMYGCLVIPPVSQEADLGILFLHNEGYSTMCGHGIIGITKVVLETGMLPISEPVTTVRIDTPAGLVTSFARIVNGTVNSVYFHNVPSFVLVLEQDVEIPGMGSIRYDVAFGGAFYAIVKALDADVGLTTGDFRELIDKGMKIKHTVMDSLEIKHPYEEDLNFLYGTIFTGDPVQEDSDSRNVCIFADGEVDRSPTGTGVSARMALHYAKNEIEIGQTVKIESIINSRFTGKVIEKTSFGGYDAVVPEVDGAAYITGQNEFYIDPEDPLKNGFILR